MTFLSVPSNASNVSILLLLALALKLRPSMHRFASPFVYLVATSGLLTALLLVIAAPAHMSQETRQRRISPGEVLGMEIAADGIAYPLNFIQQNSIIGFLNQATPLVDREPEMSDQKPFLLTIYRFEGDPLKVMLTATLGENLLLSTDLSAGEEMLIDQSQGAFKEIVTQIASH